MRGLSTKFSNLSAVYLFCIVFYKKKGKKKPKSAVYLQCRVVFYNVKEHIYHIYHGNSVPYINNVEKYSTM